MTHGRSCLILVLVLLTLAVIPSALATAQTRFVFANESPYDTKASGRLVSEPRFPDRVAGLSGPLDIGRRTRDGLHAPLGGIGAAPGLRVTCSYCAIVSDDGPVPVAR